MSDNFTKVGPILLDVMEEENPVYLARRVFLNYMTDLNLTKDDEFALTSVSLRAGGEGQRSILDELLKNCDNSYVTLVFG